MFPVNLLGVETTPTETARNLSAIFDQNFSSHSLTFLLSADIFTIFVIYDESASIYTGTMSTFFYACAPIGHEESLASSNISLYEYTGHVGHYFSRRVAI